MRRIILIILTIFTLMSCNKDEENTIAEIDKLPPATQIGANTFGCLLDGEAFTPGNLLNPLDSQYQFINGEYYFAVSGARRFSSNKLIGIGLGTIKLTINEGMTYQLFEQEDGKANGAFFLNNSTTYTTTENTGELTITNMDNQIVSGIFWFDIIDNQGIKHEIREGRFDLLYSN